jgi:RND family efflux transporter MFP subunit
VQVADVRLETWPRTVRVQGSLLADEQAVIGAKIPGRVESVPVDLGTPVKERQPLVVLDRRELDLQVTQAEALLTQACAAVGMTPDKSELELDREASPPVLLEKAQLEEAVANFERGKRLRAAISDTEFARLEALYKMADARYRSSLNNVGQQIAMVGVRRAELALARRQLAEAEIVAPFDAVVEQRHVAPGEYVQIGQALVTLVRSGKLRYTAGVPESKSSLVRTGQTILIEAPGEPQPLEAVISRVSPVVTLTSRALWIEADVANPQQRLQAGTFAEAVIVVDPGAVTITVPRSALTEFAGVQKVWVVREGKSAEQRVRTGRRDERRVEILEGLAAGDTIVSNSSEGWAGDVAAVRSSAAGAEAGNSDAGAEPGGDPREGVGE